MSNISFYEILILPFTLILNNLVYYTLVGPARIFVASFFIQELIMSLSYAGLCKSLAPPHFSILPGK